MKQRICVFTGARPNFVKVAPLVRAMSGRDDCQYRVVYAGPADDPTLEATLFSDLQMPGPDVFLGVDCENLNELTGRVMSRFETYLDQHPTDTVIVVDDLASTMAAAIVAKKRGVRLAHLVAGTRSFDIRMPKEINRLVIDGLSDLLFTAGVGSSSIATREGAELHKIYMVGNILTDQLRYCRDRWCRPDGLPEDVSAGRYMVFTLNRHALLADTEGLQRMLHAMGEAACGLPIVAPLRTPASAAVQALAPTTLNLHVLPPLGYLQFGWLTAHALGVVTDSGNVAEEATFNHVPCITLNSYTEHQETVRVGSNVLVGQNADLLRQSVTDIVVGRWKPSSLPDRWDGRTAERIVQILTTVENMCKM